MTTSQMGRKYDLPNEHKVLDILRAFGVRRAQLYGSAARGELGPASDIDLLVTLGDDFDFGTFFDLEAELEGATGREVELTTEIRPPFRKYVEPDLVDLPL